MQRCPVNVSRLKDELRSAKTELAASRAENGKLLYI